MNKTLLIGMFALCGAWLNADAPKEWTVLVYMAADNDLEEAAVDDLKEMLKVGSSDALNLVVQIDRAEGYSEDGVGGLKDWTTAKRLVVQKNKLVPLADLGEVDSASMPVLRDFVTWGLKNYPARKTALVFWDHGGGQSGFGSDEQSESGLSIPDLKKGVEDGIKAAGASRLDLVGFDACLMAALETARALAPSARYLLASEELEPGFGWDWSVLSLLNQKPTTDARALASSIIAGYAAACIANDEGAQFTLSLTDLDKVGAIEAALKTAEGSVLPQLKTLGGDFGRTRARSLEFGKSGDPASDTQMVDLGDLARQWQTVTALQAPGKALAAALQAAVVEQKSGSVQKAATGLSVWFPTKKTYYDASYASFGSPSWVRLLEGYYRAGASIPAEERANAQEQQDPGVSFDGTTVSFVRTLDPKIAQNIAEAALYYGVSTKGKTQILGARDAEVNADDAEVTGVWDLSALTLVQGKLEVPGFLSEDQADEEQMAFSVPFSYYPGRDAKNRQDVWLAVTIDIQKNEIVEETFYQETGDDLVGEFKPSRGSRIVARLLEKNKDGDWDLVDRGPALDPTKPIDYEFRTIDAKANFYLSLDITDFGGTDDSQEFEGPLP